jgi:uncharacterized repeat protein (TIGR01451 family)
VLSAFVTSVSTLIPDFTPTTKEVVDLNGGVAAPGDTLEYRIVAVNQGSDAAVNVRLRDEVPAGLSFVPGSLRIEAGANMGDKTDAAGDDQAEYDAASRTVTARLGMGATGSAGGSLAIGASTELRFQVTIDAATRGEVENQGFILAAGQQGSAESETATDADAAVDGQGPTTVTVEECGDDSHCMAPTPFCDIAQMPPKCVTCANSGQCDDPTIPDCDLATNTCVCTSGPGTCRDADDDGISDGGEDMLGTDPMDADTDDDGVIDGDEVGPDQDSDGDGTINALDPDSDGDGLPDGTELGLPCNHPGTTPGASTCHPDADGGATKTNPVDPDTDRGGIPDGQEDRNLDGKIDPGETDPNDPLDDMRCMADAECGAPNGGVICVDGACVPGCRAQSGQGCPDGQFCTSVGAEAGICQPFESARFGGGGCQCGLAGSGRAPEVLASSLLAVALSLFLRRCRRKGRPPA